MAISKSIWGNLKSLACSPHQHIFQSRDGLLRSRTETDRLKNLGIRISERRLSGAVLPKVVDPPYGRGIEM
jgi:hypothetical protein